jgi:hypothetical protein
MFSYLYIIQDTNNHAPQFPDVIYRATISEDALQGIFCYDLDKLELPWWAY